MSRKAKREVATVNGAPIYHEVRGDGPSLLMIVGATGDGAWYEEAAEILSDEFTVVIYDRRGNSRSLPPAGWEKTSVAEQADDAAALVEALGLAPIVAYGSSAGGVVALELVQRHPGILRGAIVHEPPLIGITSDPPAVMQLIESTAGPAMASGGPAAAVEAFARLHSTPGTIERFDETTRRRIFDNGPTFFAKELEAFSTWMPDTAAIAASTVPLLIAAGRDNATGTNHYLYEASQRLAEIAGSELLEMTGGHVPYKSHPEQFGEEMRLLLRKMS